MLGGSTIGGNGTLDLGAILATNLSGANGYIFNGSGSGGDAGYAVDSAGDVNGDGIADMIIGARDANVTGQSFVVFGGAGSLSAFDQASGGTDGQALLVHLGTTATNGANGFTINGIDSGDDMGRSVGSGDINADGFDDLIIGAHFADPNGVNSSGEAYVLFGGSNVGSGDGTVNLSSDLGGTGGFVLNGIDIGDNTGRSVNLAGDVNGDGIEDVVVAAPFAAPNGGSSGEVYIVFDATNVGSSGTIEATALNGANGFIFNGAASGDETGYSVSSAGDFNGDGIVDLIIGAPYADPGGNNEGKAYVLFGSTNIGVGGTVEASDLDGSNGFAINGAVAKRHIGGSVGGIGDFNGDGFDDVIVSSYTEGAAYAGSAFVIFGGATVGSSGTLNVSALTSGAGFEIREILEGDAFGDSSHGAGDVNGDGFDDLIVSAYEAEVGGSDTGASYVVFGGDFSAALTQQGSIGNDVLTGTGAADIFVGGLGNDTLLGAGGVDVLRGGAGDDMLSVSDTTFRRLDGGTNTDTPGSGGDTLAFLATNGTLNLTTLADSKVESVEIIDIGGNSGSINTLVLQLNDVLNLSESTNDLKVFGDAGDRVNTAGEAWSNDGTVVVGGQTFTQFSLGAGRLLVDPDLDATGITTI